MATRTNCVEYVGTNRDTTLSASTVEEQTITVDIPENSSRTFLSVFMEVYCSENNASTSSRGSMTARMLGVGIDAVADSDVTVTDTIADSTDQGAFCFSRDITSYFTTNFTGTSHTVGLRFSFTQSGANALTVINVSMRLVVTYQYDDASQTTRIRTVRIPLQSKFGACGTSEEEIYSNGTTSSSGTTSQIPDLSSFLPEASKTYKDIFFDVEWFDAYVGTTDQVVSLKTASDATYNPGTYEKANNTPVRHHLFWKRTDLATNAVQAFKFWATSAVHYHPVVVLTVTYTYDHDSSTDLISSTLIPFETESYRYSGGSTEPLVRALEIWVEEPATITLLHSAVVAHEATSGTSLASVSMRGGSSSYSTYTVGGLGTPDSGNYCFCHRVDSGGLGGLTLARGKNVFTYNRYHSADLVSHTSYLILNYKHGKPSSGSGVANHTIKRLVKGDAADVVTDLFTSQAEAIPETSYWLSGYGLRYMQCYVASATATIKMDILRTTGDNPDAGSSEAFFVRVATMGTRMGVIEYVMGLGHMFYRFGSDPTLKRFNPETARSWRFHTPVGATNTQLQAWATYHSITFDKTSAVTGSGGGTVNWRLCYNGASSYLLQPGEKVASGTRSGNGNVTLTWYDDTESMFVEAYEDSSHVGRSYNFTMA